MRVVVFSSFVNNFGDLSFGKKICDLLKELYPHVEIDFVTDSTKTLAKKRGTNHVATFNQNTSIPLVPLDKYNKSTDGDPELLIIGPSLNVLPNEVLRHLISYANTPIMLMTEYNFPYHYVEDFRSAASKLGYTNFLEMPTGINQPGGVFIDPSIVNFNILDKLAIKSVTDNLIVTGNTLLGDRSLEEYSKMTDVAVNYSHKNSERFIVVHSLTSSVSPNKNVDLIILGDNDRKDKEVLENLAAMLLAKSFSKVIYEVPGEKPIVIAAAEVDGPIYRVVHTGRVTPTESIALRKLCGLFGGATGDQSYSEAIARSPVVVYECQTWKRGVLDAMEELATKIDASKELRRTIELLGTASTKNEYEELASLLLKKSVQDNLIKFQQTIIQDHNLTKNLPKQAQKFITENMRDRAWRVFGSIRDTMSEKIRKRKKESTRSEKSDTTDVLPEMEKKKSREDLIKSPSSDLVLATEKNAPHIELPPKVVNDEKARFDDSVPTLTKKESSKTLKVDTINPDEKFPEMAKKRSRGDLLKLSSDDDKPPDDSDTNRRFGHRS